MLDADAAFDLAIVGAGPAGIACALQAQRDGLGIVILDDGKVGGLVRSARRVDNLAGYPQGVAGHTLAKIFGHHIQQCRIPLLPQRVTRVEHKQTGFCLHCGDGTNVLARSVFVATGTRPRDAVIGGFSVPSVGEIVHRDLCDFVDDVDNQTCLVVGGGDAAIDTAMSLADRKAQVVLAMRGEQPHANPALLGEYKTYAIETHTRCIWREMRLRPHDLHVSYQCLQAANFTRDFAHAFMCLGRMGNQEPISHLLAAPLSGVCTDVMGLFVGGDLIRTRDRFISMALGDGQKAARLALAYLRQLASSSAVAKRDGKKWT